MGFENFLDTLNEKHKKEDALLDAGKKELAEKGINTLNIISSLDALYLDMANENYENLDKQFQQIKGELHDLNIEKIKPKINLIAEGIRNKEYAKYDSAMKAIKEIREFLNK